jgi:hypothetical protein
MKRTVLVGACLLALVFATGALAKGPKVNIGSWSVETADFARHVAKPGSTYRPCASNPAIAIDAHGSVSGATSGTPFKEIWTLNGKPDSVFQVAWSKSGRFSDSFGISASDAELTPGRWKLKIVQGGKRIGGGSIKIFTKPGC